VVLSFTVGAWAIEAGSAWQGGTNKPVVNGVTFVEMTVEDLDRSIEFYSPVLSLSKVREVEVLRDSWEHLDGVFGVRVRFAWLRLGGEQIALKEYLTRKGRPAPRSPTATIAGFSTLRLSRPIWIAPTAGSDKTRSAGSLPVRNASLSISRLRRGFVPSTLTIPTGIRSKSCNSRQIKGTGNGIRRRRSCLWV
jgi:hypothetical protein